MLAWEPSWCRPAPRGWSMLVNGHHAASRTTPWQQACTWWNLGRLIQWDAIPGMIVQPFAFGV
jgi:hypothetical protein